MIVTATDHQKTQEELTELEGRLRCLDHAYLGGDKSFTKAGIRKIIARLHEELVVYEGSEETRRPETD